MSCDFYNAYDEYAVKAFKYNSIDYLLKPIDKDELEAAIEKFEILCSGHTSSILWSMNCWPIFSQNHTGHACFLPYRDGYKKISIEDIAFFYSVWILVMQVV